MKKKKKGMEKKWKDVDIAIFGMSITTNKSL